jgi:hypothetical protein
MGKGDVDALAPGKFSAEDEHKEADELLAGRVNEGGVQSNPLKSHGMPSRSHLRTCEQHVF